MILTANKPFSIKERIIRSQKPTTANFYDYVQEMKNVMREDSEQKDDKYTELSSKAHVADPEAVAYFLNEIEKHLRIYPFTGKLPGAYRNVVEGLFQEWKGFGPSYEWFTNRKYAESTGLQIIGEQIFYNEKGSYKLFPYSMNSLDRVDQLKRSLLQHDERKKLDSDNPSAELKMNDPIWPGRFIRIAIWDNPRVWDGFTTITLRRQVVEYLSLEDQAGTQAIPSESVMMIKELLGTYRNTVIAGPVGSGKTTFANTVVGEQLQGREESTGVIMIEKHPESILPYVIKGHRIIPVQAENDELMEVGLESLRMDPNIIYMTEMRYNEWEFYIWSGSKGYDGITGTFHTVDAEDIPYQGAFAVYTQRGGSLEGHLMSALQACQLVFIMEPADNGKKRLTRISEIQYDNNAKTVYANDIMRFEKDQWVYNDQISGPMLQKMDKKNPAATTRFLDEIKKLAAAKPMINPRIESLKSHQVLRG
jgi:pilus assembly protein CpaF